MSDTKELLESINWAYLSFASILDITNNFPEIRNDPAFHKILKEEINRRLEGREPDNQARRSYKYQVNEEFGKPFISVLSDAFFEQKEELSSMIKSYCVKNEY